MEELLAMRLCPWQQDQDRFVTFDAAAGATALDKFCVRGRSRHSGVSDLCNGATSEHWNTAIQRSGSRLSAGRHRGKRSGSPHVTHLLVTSECSRARVSRSTDRHGAATSRSLIANHAARN